MRRQPRCDEIIILLNSAGGWNIRRCLRLAFRECGLGRLSGVKLIIIIEYFSRRYYCRMIGRRTFEALCGICDENVSCVKFDGRRL